MGAVTPETCRVTLQWINICILLHLIGFLLTLSLQCLSPLPVGLSKDDITPWSLAHTGVCVCVCVKLTCLCLYPRKLSFPLTLGTSAVRSFFFHIPSYSLAHLKITELDWTTVFMKFRLLTLGPVNTRQTLHSFFIKNLLAATCFGSC